VKLLARLEGFEPPTLRSEVLSKTLSAETRKKTIPLSLRFLNIDSGRFYLISRHCGNRDGNIPKAKSPSPRRARERLKWIFHSDLVKRVGRGICDYAARFIGRGTKRLSFTLFVRSIPALKVTSDSSGLSKHLSRVMNAPIEDGSCNQDRPTIPANRWMNIHKLTSKSYFTLIVRSVQTNPTSGKFTPLATIYLRYLLWERSSNSENLCLVVSTMFPVARTA
jgi:hypothetical protein